MTLPPLKPYARLAHADLTDMNLVGVDLSHANLLCAKLTSVDCARANFSGADLTHAHLAGADFAGANFEGANLFGANLFGANLAGANFAGANFEGANLFAYFSPTTRLDGCTLPTGETWETYCADVVPALCTCQGVFLATVCAAWDCHQWENCPMSLAFGVTNFEKIPALYKPRVEQFFYFFDARLLPNPMALLTQHGGPDV